MDPNTISTKASGGGFRRATNPRDSLRGEVRAFRHAASSDAFSCSVGLNFLASFIKQATDYLYGSLLLVLPGDDLLSQGPAPQVLSALERKADEPFATLRPHTHTPAVWILNFRVRVYEKRTSFSPRCVPIRILLQRDENRTRFSPHCDL